jgi:hypothetical protein
VVPSKKPDSASATSDAVVLGASSGSSVIVKSPQFVSTTSSDVVPGSSDAVGAVWPPSCFGSGASTVSQPPAPDDASVVAPPVSDDEASVVAATVSDD